MHNIVLNELSVQSTHCQIADRTPKVIISDFVALLHTLLALKKNCSIVASKDIYSFKITSDYGSKNWFDDPHVKHEHKQFLRSVHNRCTLISTENYADSQFDVKIDGSDIPGIGCLVAYKTDLNVIGARTHQVWEDRTIYGIYETLDDNGNILTKHVGIGNISSEEHINQFEQQELLASLEHIYSGQDLWENKEKLFPNLQFCKEVKKQLYNDPEKVHIDQVAKRLKHLNDYFSTYDGIYDPKKLGMDARTESQTVKLTPELRDMRLFTKPDGTQAHFFDHIGFSGKYNSGRIYFLNDSETKTGIIGYIGKHLKTDRFNP